MTSSAVTQKPAKDQQVAADPSRQAQYAREEKEQSASASASAGLNLNIFGAISGAFSGKSKKEKQPDGSEVEHRQDNSAIKGAGMGNMNAAGAADAETRGREMRERIMAGEK